MESIKTPQSLSDAMNTPRLDRMVYWYDLPKRIVDSTGFAKLGLIELTSGEEIMATRRAGSDPIRLAFELAKESVRFALKVNETTPIKISTGDGTSDAIWNSSKAGISTLRQLALTAYGDIHNPKGDEAEDFLASRTIKV